MFVPKFVVCFVVTPHSLPGFLSDAGVKAAATVTPAAATPVKRLDNLFFIEEPKSISVTESKLTPDAQNNKVNALTVNKADPCPHEISTHTLHFSSCRGHCHLHRKDWRRSHSQCEMDEGQMEANHPRWSHLHPPQGPGRQDGDQGGDEVRRWNVQVRCFQQARRDRVQL